MSPRSWKVLSAVAVVLLLGGAATADDDDDVGTFGPWRITFTPANHVYNLIGSGQGESFKIQCHPNHTGTTLFFPIWTKSSKPYAKTEIPVMVWSDSSPAKSLRFLVKGGLLAIAINSPQHPDPTVDDFIEALASAKTSFAFSYLEQTFEFDAKFLPVARRKFAEVCALNF